MQRKLTAILAADVVGYSRLMEGDEAGTLDRLKVNRSDIFDPSVAAHGGRLIKLMGDGALVEFPSVIDAVKCAVAIQDATSRAEAEQSETQRIRYRIGVNLGDVIVQGDDIYGEGVNVASRLEGLAPAGGIALSRTVREQVEGKVAGVFDDLGEHTVKNIQRPVHVFSLRPAGSAGSEAAKSDTAGHFSICVLPFANMSGDPEQEYFSDGITEDIITDLSKISALSVISRNSAFTFKGKRVEVPQVARQLKVSHVLEGSVRKSGGRVRITAQLVDGATDSHVWADRFDRELNDIFALQDEISEAIVKALKLKLLPEEKKAIERRGTDNAEAYNLYLMARQYYISGNIGDVRRDEAIIRLCRRATEIDPNYARAWALVAMAQQHLRTQFGRVDENGLLATERALALDANLAEAHAIKALICAENGRHDEASNEIAVALRLDSESYEVNRAAANLCFRQHRLDDAIRHYEKATTLMVTDFSSPGMLITCFTAKGDSASARHAAQVSLARVEKVVTQDQNNGSAMGFGVSALATLGEAERAKEWINRALLIDPDNLNMRYNFACALAVYLKDVDAALGLLEQFFAKTTLDFIKHAKVDPDLDLLRDDPRYRAMVAAAEARVAHA